MKNFQVNLLIVFALALCGLCAFQWREQTFQRNEIGSLNGMVYGKNAFIQDATNSLAVLNHQVEQMDARLTEFRAAAATNDQIMAAQRSDISGLKSANSSLSNSLVQYKATVDTLQARLQEAYAGVQRQNGSISNLLQQRDELVRKLNESVKDRNDLVEKYNDLVERVEVMQRGQK